MKPLAKIIVKETAGIRRFLYPLQLFIGGPIGSYGSGLFVEGPIEPSPEGRIENVRVCELDGTLVPSESWPMLPGEELERHQYSIYFAVSLAPHEERELLIAETDEVPAIPDPMSLSYDENDGLTTEQERLKFHIGVQTGLDSIVYDGIEHLAGPLNITLDGKALGGDSSLLTSVARNNGLVAALSFRDRGPGATYELTACKSWVRVIRMLDDLTGGQTVVFSLPLRTGDEIATCDFGVGNGVYEKIAGDAVMWTTEFGEKPYARWRVSTVNAGVERIDYQGKYQSVEEFAGCAWFHWVEKTKALAVAIPSIHHYCDKMTVSLARSGKIDIAFTIAPSAPAGVNFSVCYHFLNDIPAIAAATNPASILLPPTVEIRPLD